MRSSITALGLLAFMCTTAAAQTVVSRVSAAQLQVDAGMRPVQLTVYGLNLGTVSAARILQSGRTATGLERL